MKLVAPKRVNIQPEQKVHFHTSILLINDSRTNRPDDQSTVNFMKPFSIFYFSIQPDVIIRTVLIL